MMFIQHCFNVDTSTLFLSRKNILNLHKFWHYFVNITIHIHSKKTLCFYIFACQYANEHVILISSWHINNIWKVIKIMLWKLPIHIDVKYISSLTTFINNWKCGNFETKEIGMMFKRYYINVITSIQIDLWMSIYWH